MLKKEALFSKMKHVLQSLNGCDEFKYNPEADFNIRSRLLRQNAAIKQTDVRHDLTCAVQIARDIKAKSHSFTN